MERVSAIALPRAVLLSRLFCIYLRPLLLEGCGQAQAWRCADRFPLPPTIFTLAHAAALKNFTTLFVGKCV
jgi:hypothetical protein